MIKLAGFKCKGCGRVFYPKRTRCLDCRREDFEEVDLGDKCRLLTFTELYALPRGIDRVPLRLGIVEFEGGVKAFGQIETDDQHRIRVGMLLKPVWGELRRVGREVVFGYKFEQLNQGKRPEL